MALGPMVLGSGVKTDTALNTSGIPADAKATGDALASMHPIGCIYQSIDPTSPAKLFGGTWERIKDRFLLSAGDVYGAGLSGGEAMHTLSVDEMPSHEHDELRINDIKFTVWSERGSGPIFDMSSLYNASAPNNNYFGTGSAGGGQSHNNMPPYWTVYMWRRVA